MILIHVIIHHLEEYFSMTGVTMKDTNEEFVETVHSSLENTKKLDSKLFARREPLNI